MEYNRKIDGYNVYDEPSRKDGKEERTRNIVITYYSNHEVFAHSQKYSDVSEEKVKKVRDMLFDYTIYNMNQQHMTTVIPFFTIVNEVERIILGK